MSTYYRVTHLAAQTTMEIEGDEIFVVYDEEQQTLTAVSALMTHFTGKDPRVVTERDGTEERVWIF